MIVLFDIINFLKYDILNKSMRIITETIVKRVISYLEFV